MIRTLFLVIIMIIITSSSYSQDEKSDPGCNASFISYTGKIHGADMNILLFSNAESPEKRENLTLKYSLDQGKSWSKVMTIYKGKSITYPLQEPENTNALMR